IRDFHVTGVQTCALPIFPRQGSWVRRQPGSGRRALPAARTTLNVWGTSVVLLFSSCGTLRVAYRSPRTDSQGCAGGEARRHEGVRPASPFNRGSLAHTLLSTGVSPE